MANLFGQILIIFEIVTGLEPNEAEGSGGRHEIGRRLRAGFPPGDADPLCRGNQDFASDLGVTRGTMRDKNEPNELAAATTAEQ